MRMHFSILLRIVSGISNFPARTSGGALGWRTTLAYNCSLFNKSLPMRAIEITQPGKPEVLQLCERPTPAKS
jgi:hypothetical protein